MSTIKSDDGLRRAAVYLFVLGGIFIAAWLLLSALNNTDEPLLVGAPSEPDTASVEPDAAKVEDSDGLPPLNEIQAARTEFVTTGERELTAADRNFEVFVSTERGWRVYQFDALETGEPIDAVPVSSGLDGVVGYALETDLLAINVEASMKSCVENAGKSAALLCDPKEIAESVPGGALVTDGPGPRVYDFGTDKHIGWLGEAGFERVQEG